MKIDRIELEFGIATLLATSSVILLVAFVACFALRRSAAAARHLVWLVAFAAILVLPIARFVAPAREVPIPFTLPRVEQTEVAAAPLAAVAALDLQSDKSELLSKLPVSLPEDLQTAVQTAQPSQAEGSSRSGLWMTIFFGLWVAGVGVFMLQIIAGVIQLRRIRSQSGETIQALGPSALLALSLRAGLRRRWSLRVNQGAVPPAAMTWGAVRPIVLLPEESSKWTERRLEAVVLHELAHVRRWDSLTQLLSATVCALYWFNPLVWLAARAMRAESECAADDLVLSTGIKPSSYAAELLRIAAELGHRRQPFASVGVSVMKQAKIESRVVAILDNSRTRRGVGSLQALAAAAVGLSLLVPAAAIRPVIGQIPTSANSNVPTTHIAAHQEAANSELDALIADLSALQNAPADPTKQAAKAAAGVKPRSAGPTRKGARHAHNAKPQPKAQASDVEKRLHEVMAELVSHRAELAADHKRLTEVLALLEAEKAKTKALTSMSLAKSAADATSISRILSQAYVSQPGQFVLPPKPPVPLQYQGANMPPVAVNPNRTVPHGYTINPDVLKVIPQVINPPTIELKSDPTAVRPEVRYYVNQTPSAIVDITRPGVKYSVSQYTNDNKDYSITIRRAPGEKADPFKVVPPEHLFTYSADKKDQISRYNLQYKELNRVSRVYDSFSSLFEKGSRDSIQSQLKRARLELQAALSLIKAQQQEATANKAAQAELLKAQDALRKAEEALEATRKAGGKGN